jgi:hypothetical protein
MSLVLGTKKEFGIFDVHNPVTDIAKEGILLGVFSPIMPKN